MIICFWNPRGIQAPGRKSALIDLFQKYSPNTVGFQETKKKTISDNYLNSLVGNRMFSWTSLPAIGSTGGKCVGVDSEVFDVISWEVRSFSVSVVLKIKTSGLILRLLFMGPLTRKRKRPLFQNYIASV
jgi:hypothetical protein